MSKSISKMSFVWNYSGNCSQALRCVSQCKQLYEKYFDKRHLDYLISLRILSISLLNVGNYSEALNTIKLCIDLTKEALGDKNPEYLFSLGNLAVVLMQMESFEEAL